MSRRIIKVTNNAIKNSGEENGKKECACVYCACVVFVKKREETMMEGYFVLYTPRLF